MAQFAEGLAALEDAEAIMTAHVADLNDARELINRCRERIHTQEWTVVACAGATGSGKSSLVNALVGSEVARVAPTRPTTSTPLGVSSTDAGSILDWLDVSQRHVLGHLPKNVLLIDLPDIDSYEEANREEAARLIGKVDALIWVLDPQKYADSIVHEEYLRRMKEHAALMCVALNQIDRVPVSERDAVVADVRSLVRQDGTELDVFPVSATTREGIADVIAWLEKIASSKKASVERLAADMRTHGQNYEEKILEEGGVRPRGISPDFQPIVKSALSSAGVPIVLEATEKSYIVRAGRETGWPIMQFIRQIPDPLERLHLKKARASKDIFDQSHAVSASSLLVSASARSRLSSDLTRYSHEFVQDFPVPWRGELVVDSDDRANSLLTLCDQTIATADLGQETRGWWWTPARVVQWLGTLSMVVGIVWLVLFHAGQWLEIQLPDPPAWGIFSLPSLLLLGGMFVCVFVSVTASLLAKRVAAMVKKRAAQHLTSVVTTQAEESILQPLRMSASDYARLWSDIDTLKSVRI